MSIVSTIIEKLIAEASPKIIMAVIGGLVLVGGGTGVAITTSLHRHRAPKLTSTEAVVDEIKQIGQFRTSAYCDEIVIKEVLDSVPSVKERVKKGEKVKGGEIVPGRHTSPAYSPAFIEAVKEATGDRYVRKEI